MEATFSVENPDTWHQPWWGMRRYRRYEDVYEEAPCAEDNFSIGAAEYHVPEAKTPDF